MKLLSSTSQFGLLHLLHIEHYDICDGPISVWFAPALPINFAPPELISVFTVPIGCGIVFGLVAVLFMVSVRFCFTGNHFDHDPHLSQRWYAVAWHGISANSRLGDGDR